MEYIKRIQEESIRRALARKKSILLLGARQTGKTTLVQRLQVDLTITLVRPDVRQRYEKNPSLLANEVDVLCDRMKPHLPTVCLDEVQKIPQLLDVVQDLIDRNRGLFILTGSSARKLRHGSEINLLPGRIIPLKLDPFIIHECSSKPVENTLLFGSLPGILSIQNHRDRETDLESYVTTYLEEEIRAEAIVRNVGHFGRFLEYAASESGQLVNYRKLSQEIGISHTTIASYFQILEDCLIIERIDPLSESKTRKKLTQSQKFLFFDLGVRRVAAGEGTKLSRNRLGELFEQFVGLELIRCSHLSNRKIKIRFWRDPDGPEVDWIIDEEGSYTPIEVKWTATPKLRDIRHVKTFLSEYPSSQKGYLICQVPRKLRLDKQVEALPWQDVDEFLLS